MRASLEFISQGLNKRFTRGWIATLFISYTPRGGARELARDVKQYRRLCVFARVPNFGRGSFPFGPRTEVCEDDGSTEGGGWGGGEEDGKRGDRERGW